MPRTSAAGQDVQDDYVRQLLDQQAARAGFHARFSSSDLSDTLSVYSRSLFSSRPAERGEPPSPTSAHYLASHGHIPLASNADRERLNDPSCSSLDFDDASDVSSRSSLRDEQEDSDQPFVSLLGPKMRFHSRAPWEMDDTLHEEHVTTPELTRTITNKTMTQAAKFFNFGPSSPRVSNVSRASGESLHPEIVHKTSMDSNTEKGFLSRGPMYLHKQGTISSASLGRVSNDSRSDRVRRPSLGPPSPTSTVSSPYTTSLLGSRLSIDTDPARLKRTSFDYGDRRESMDNSRMFFSSPTPSELYQSYHPYANPDLVISRTPEPYESFDSPSVSREIVSSKSTGTVTETSIPSSGSADAATLTSDSSTASVDPSSAILGREISKPIALASHDLQRDDKNSSDPCSHLSSNVHKFPGWKEKTPSFGLISLEEARARRARSATQPSLAGRPSNVSLDGESIPPVPGPEVQGTQLPQDSSNQKSRARSSSAGAKAKNALQSVRGAQPRSETLPGALMHAGPSPGKSLKQKRSGFLRLLIGSKTQDREDQTQLPPVPTLPDWTSNGLQQTVSTTPRVPRVPVPKIATVFDNVEPDNDDGTASPTALVESPKRTRPPLSIGTGRTHLPPILAISESPEMQTVTVDTHQQHWLTANASRSAPANIHNFPPSIPPLQLRPTSTLFSSHFEGHLCKEDSRPSLETDTSTLRSPSCYSPVTPRSIGLFNNEKVRKTSADNDDQSPNLAWEMQVRELEGQVRDLQAQLDELNAAANRDPCEVCGRGLRLNGGLDRTQSGIGQQTKTGVVNRSRVRTGNSTRFGNCVE